MQNMHPNDEIICRQCGWVSIVENRNRDWMRYFKENFGLFVTLTFEKKTVDEKVWVEIV